MKTNGAFSLVELLVVIGILVVLMGLVMPSLNSFGGARNLENAGSFYVDQWNLARQEAVTKNRVVEFRLLQYRDKDDPTGAEEIRAFQFLQETPDGSWTALSRVLSLPTGVIIDGSPEGSSLAALPTRTLASSEVSTSRAEGPVHSRSIAIRPDGSTDLPHDESHFLMFRLANDSSSPPKNYFTIAIEPTTGRLQTFRP